MDWMPYGPDGILIRFEERIGECALERSRALIGELEENPPPGLLEYVPAFTTLLLEFDPVQVPNAAAIAPELVARLDAAGSKHVARPTAIDIPVCYDGPDLSRVAELHSLSPAEVIELHTRPIYNVYMLGFSPGFPYLGDLDPRLHTPRLATPRSVVSAGSVAIGGEHTGIYSVPTPGGWNIIGQTNIPLFDPNRPEPEMFFLRPGDRVRFVPVKQLERRHD